MSWPSIDLDPVRRLHVLAAALPGAVVGERLLDAPFDAVWELIDDLEHTAPQVEPAIKSARFVERQGEQLVMLVRPPIGREMRLDVILRPGWCLLRSPRTVAGLCATPRGERTLFAHMEGLKVPGARLAVPILRRKIPRELATMERLAQERASGRNHMPSRSNGS